MLVSIFSAELGSTADTCTATVYGALKKLTYSFRAGVLSEGAFE